VKSLALSWFGGFFLAMACINVIYAVLMRSAAGAAYALLTIVMAGNALFSIGHQTYGAAPLHALLFAAYLCAVVLFASTLLQTMRYDVPYARATIVLLALNLPLTFLYDLLPAWGAYLYAIDRLALVALFAMLLVLGVRAWTREGPVISGSYLAAIVGPAIGVALNDLAEYHVAGSSLGLALSFHAALVWEALFLAFAVAYRNRGVQGERDRVERLAYLDGLTGVANRRTFDETLERMWNVARRARVPVAICMVDIDFFKRLNDTRGHQVGDECLRRVAGLCSSVLRRAGDCFARYGGEEFAAILVNVDLAHATTLAEAMRRVVERDGGITISIGVAAGIPQAGDRSEGLIAEADRALYAAKNDGRNCVRVASAGEYAMPVNTRDDLDSVPPPDRRLERR
jgi:diguanylate cyclase (GGDEF)-like protein